MISSSFADGALSFSLTITESSFTSLFWVSKTGLAATAGFSDAAVAPIAGISVTVVSTTTISSLSLAAAFS